MVKLGGEAVLQIKLTFKYKLIEICELANEGVLITAY